jgi:hypothetical protein
MSWTVSVNLGKKARVENVCDQVADKKRDDTWKKDGPWNDLAGLWLIVKYIIVLANAEADVGRNG